jgi:hypothetical protein
MNQEQINEGLILLERAPKEQWRYEASDWCCLCPGEPHTKLSECSDREIYAPASIGGSAFCIDLGDYHGLSDESAELIVYLKNNAPALLAAAQRAQELEAELSEVARERDALEYERRALAESHEQLEAQNKVLREALEWYANGGFDPGKAKRALAAQGGGE